MELIANKYPKMTKTVTTPYHVAEYLRPEESAAYLEACLEEADGNAAFIAKVLGDIARARRISQIRKKRELARIIFKLNNHPLKDGWVRESWS